MYTPRAGDFPRTPLYSTRGGGGVFERLSEEGAKLLIIADLGPECDFLPLMWTLSDAPSPLGQDLPLTLSLWFRPGHSHPLADGVYGLTGVQAPCFNAFYRRAL